MTVFGAYARYYDVIYRQKDYAAEVGYVWGLLCESGRGPGAVLDLGCGTGRHALCLAEQGAEVTGIDRSEGMVAAARSHAAEVVAAVRERVRFALGDIRDLDLGRRFDAVVSLFHVMSYQVEADDVVAAMRTAGRHLERGGRFVFDFWHGPGVLKLGPQPREKTFVDGALTIRRRVEPVLRAERQCVEMEVTLEVQDGQTGREECIQERHVMRYFFREELEDWCRQAGLRMGRCVAWMTDRDAGPEDWSACCVAERAD